MIELSLPENMLQWTWLLIGFMFARGFGKKSDQAIQETDWFKQRGALTQWVIKRLLDFFHHFWMGLLLMVYPDLFAETGLKVITANQYITWGLIPDVIATYWFGVGVFLDDLPDIPTRFRKYFKYFVNGNGNNNTQ